MLGIFMLQLLLVLVVTGGVYLIFRPHRMAAKMATRVVGFGLTMVVFIFMLLLVRGFGTVPTGYVGAEVVWGDATGRPYDGGLYFVNPFSTRIELINCQIKERTIQLEAASKDMQDVSFMVTANYRIPDGQAVNMFMSVKGGEPSFVATILDPAINDVGKYCVSQFKPEEMLQNREELRTLIMKTLPPRVAPYAEITNIAVSNIEFSDVYTKAIEDKVVAQQRALTAENDLKRVEFETKQMVAQATGEAEKIRIQAEAIQKQGGQAYVMLQLVNKWSGTFPQTMVLSGASGPFEIFNIGDFVK